MRRATLESALIAGAAVAALFDLGVATPRAGAEESPVAVHGFVLGLFTGRTTGALPAGGSDYVLAEERLRLELEGSSESGEAFFLAKGDVFHDAITGSFDVELREAYAGYGGGPLEIRLGRHVATWGVGDLFFINDVFPKDWESFFAGRPMEYLKLGVDGLLLRHSTRHGDVELFVVPTFTPDTMPSSDRFVFPNPFGAAAIQREKEPNATYSNTELALRLARNLAGFDLAAYAYRGFWRTPALSADILTDPATVTRVYPELSVYGFSAQRALLGGVVSLEAGYYDSRQDRAGGDPVAPNSQWRFLIGHQRQLGEELTLGMQIYAETLEHYEAYRASLPSGAPRQDRNRWVVSSRLTQLLHYQTWRLSVFAAYSPSDRDYFVKPEVTVKLTDSLAVLLGASVFGGRHETTFFGQLDRSDNVSVGLRYDF